MIYFISNHYDVEIGERDGKSRKTAEESGRRLRFGEIKTSRRRKRGKKIKFSKRLFRSVSGHLQRAALMWCCCDFLPLPPIARLQQHRRTNTVSGTVTLVTTVTPNHRGKFRSSDFHLICMLVYLSAWKKPDTCIKFSLILPGSQWWRVCALFLLYILLVVPNPAAERADSLIMSERGQEKKIFCSFF